MYNEARGLPDSLFPDEDNIGSLLRLENDADYAKYRHIFTF